MRKRLGDILAESGVISQKQLEDALDEQKKNKKRLGEILISKGILDEDAIADVLSNQLRLERVRLRNTVISPDVVRIIPESVARRYNIVPVSLHGDTLKVAFSDPLDVKAQDELSFLTGYKIEPVVASPSEISQTIENLYSIKEEARRLVESIAANKREAAPEVEGEEDAPVVKLVNYIISRAVEERASDIHFEPQEDGLLIRYRVDGLLRYVEQFSLDMALPVVSRLKIMAGMDIAEKRLPQDGRVVLKVGGKDVDIRISTLPTVYGEKVVLRLLDRTSILIGLEKLGLLEDDMKKIVQMISRPYGMLLVTGPTGSGKTTTLYSILNRLAKEEYNVVTVEDPVEYELKGINQVQVNEKAGLLFSTALRSILRQDPDIIMVGEIRDYETAELAVRAALTGHFVLSTLHTNDAPGALTRLVDMGVEPFLIASSVVGVVAQRLVRKICEQCKEPYLPAPEVITENNLPEGTLLYRGKGCEHCRFSGYRGRTAIFEVMKMSEQISALVMKKASSGEVRQVAIGEGMKTLFENGKEKVISGITTLEEVLRVSKG